MADGGTNEGDSTEHNVMSDIHLGCPPSTFGPYNSRFTISLPPEVESSRYNLLFKDEASPTKHQDVSFDEDGDLVLPRRSQLCASSVTMTIQHNVTSSIPNVGLQVWKAELVLADFVLHKMCTSSELDGIVSIELGAGTGIVGMLLACGAQTVFLTDHGDEILDNCVKNVTLNSGLLNFQAAIHVRELDWLSPWPRKVNNRCSASSKKYAWTSSQLVEVQGSTMIFAADVIYSDELTDAFFSILERLMSHGSEKILYLALEKRYNFSIDDLDVVANGYSRFRGYIREELELESLQHGTSPRFVGKPVNLKQIPQYIKDYDRGHDIELWQIRYNITKL